MAINEQGRQTLARLEEAEKAGKINAKGQALLSRLREASAPKPEIPGYTKTALDILPTAGAVIGGALASPGIVTAAGGAALGGAAGKAFQQMGRRLYDLPVPETSGEAAKDIGIEGAKQGLYEVGGGLAAKGIAGAGTGAARRALGFTKRFLGNRKQVKAAQEAAASMVDEGVVTPLAGAEKMLSRVATLKDEAGKRIQGFLESQGIGFDTRAAIERLESLRPPKRGGKYDAIHSKIDQAIETIQGHGRVARDPLITGFKDVTPIGFQEANRLKGVFQDAANFMSNKAADATDQAIAGAFREFLDESLETASKQAAGGKEFAGFMRDKSLYKNASHAEEALNNRLSSELGNKSIGLTDWLAPGVGAALGTAAGPFGAGVGAIAVPVLKKLGEKYGPQTAAVLGRQLSKNPRLLPDLARVAGYSIEQVANESRPVYAETVEKQPETASKIQDFDSPAEAREASKKLKPGRIISIQGAKAVLVPRNRANRPGAPLAIRYLESPPANF